MGHLRLRQSQNVNSTISAFNKSWLFPIRSKTVLVYYGWCRVLSWMKHLKGASDWHLVQFAGGWISGNSLQKKIRRLRGLIHHLIGPMREGSGWLTNEETAVHLSPLCLTFLHCVFSPLWLFSTVSCLHCDYSPVCPTHQLSRSTRDPPTHQRRPPILVNILTSTSKSSILTQT